MYCDSCAAWRFLRSAPQHWRQPCRLLAAAPKMSGTHLIYRHQAYSIPQLSRSLELADPSISHELDWNCCWPPVHRPFLLPDMPSTRAIPLLVITLCADVASSLELQPLISSDTSESQETSLARQPANTSLQHSGGSSGFWALMRRKEVWAICVAQYAGESDTCIRPGRRAGSHQRLICARVSSITRACCHSGLQ